ncbi:MAG: peptide chain release factor N(5)-glutamine methyltransferase [Eubacterium sp.]|nr:peptide chain release factor N(5)-glutamine methyltransferase [Eubacterium sp.]
MNLKEAYSYSVRFLQGNNVDEADFKALCVCCAVAGIKNSEYSLHINDDIIHSRLAEMLWALREGEPLQYVIGKWDFYESEFCVGKGVLIPRPETEELVELVYNYAKELERPVIIDLCAGSGCIGISLAKKLNSSVYLVEKSKDAFEYLCKNSRGVENAFPINADINDMIDLPKADIIVSNPPYIKSGDLDSLQSEVKREPKIALDGGMDGLDFYRIINDKWADKLRDFGKLFLEIGNDQGKSINDILINFKNIRVKKDIYGNDRMVVADKR